MKSILNLIYSAKATLILLLVFAVAMATATFIEDKFDTPTAYRFIYGTLWFELIMVLLAINFIGNINRYNLLSKKKFAGFLFHSAFIVIIIGAGVTRYFGYEGMMHIREGQSSNIIVTQQKVLKILALDKGSEMRYDIPLNLNHSSDIKFKKSIDTKEDGDLKINYKNYLMNPGMTYVENVEGGVDVIKLNVLDHGSESDVFIKDKEISGVCSYKLTFNNLKEKADIHFFEKEGKYFVQASFALNTVSIPDMAEKVIPADSSFEMSSNIQFSSPDNSFKFIFHNGYKKAKQQLVEGAPAQNALSALIADVNFKNKSYEVPLIIGADGNAEMQNANIEGITLLMGYGEQEIKLPFSLFLNDFILERYPGSSNPSSYASEVTIRDSRAGIVQNFRIFMNHILDYDGFRFFQSSYDSDEKGTILSVNHDFWGTWITYLGYFLMSLGFVLTLFNRNSRFQILSRNIREIKKMRMNGALTLFFILGLSSLVSSQEVIRKPVSKEHAEKLGQLIVQTFDGRSEPVHTLAYDVLHKISRKDKFQYAEKGEMDAMQVFIDITLDPVFWKNQKIIYVREKSVSDKLGIEGKYASYHDLADKDQNFKLKEFSEIAFRKKPQEQNPFDKEIIKVSERLEIFIMLTQGSLLRIFPEPVPDSKVWISWIDPQAQVLIEDNMNVLKDLRIPQLNYNNFMGSYLNAAYTATADGDFSRANRILGYIEEIQRNSAIADLIPSQNQVKFEIFYNKAGIFTALRNIYGILAVVLLILAYVENFIEKRNHFISASLKFFRFILVAAFLYHTFGLGLRWYLSGHAPWSNGYEVLLFVGWAGILAGFSFARYSKIPLAATALLAFFALMTASHSSYDPQITNLQPVLKSYWLIIHVATLTISYGFLGLAFILGIFILSLYVFRNLNNTTRFGLLIKELSNINEMNITIGLFLATIGTFLGGVWANESWGRYWGWDAKETWALIITIVYTIVVHLRLVDKLRGDYFFTVGSVVGFGSVMMTFIGVNYYFSKGMHSYGTGDTPMFPIWGWILILSLIALIIGAGLKDRYLRKKEASMLEASTE
ncbi:MAG: cytochrome c biogenesis protein CcsA [Bacteroidota bacterium]|nr:cytochrome c biogenesis protein CcsA [Bacteroidota bacterium]